LAYIAGRPNGKRAGAQEISTRQGIPISFLEKILQALRRRGFLQAVRGTGGGYRLAVPADQIRLIQILQLFGEGSETDQCLMSARGCSPATPCILHCQWADLRRQLFDRLERTTVADLAADFHHKGEAA
jgi:Rrf2 family iron-sulfur cluster assembly transcriptional regulator